MAIAYYLLFKQTNRVLEIIRCSFSFRYRSETSPPKFFFVFRYKNDLCSKLTRNWLLDGKKWRPQSKSFLTQRKLAIVKIGVRN